MFCVFVLFICGFAAGPVIMDEESSLHPGGGGESSVFIGQVLLKLQKAVYVTISGIRQRVIQSFAVFSVVLLLLWIAAFLYGSLYYSYMPNSSFFTPVHYYYRCVCEVLFSCTRKTQTQVTVCWISSLLLCRSFMFLSPEPTVSLLLLSCVLTQWPTSHWWETENMYVWTCVCVFNISRFTEEFWISLHAQVLTFGQAYHISLKLEMPDSLTNQALGMFMIKTAFFSQDGGQVASSAWSVSCSTICSPLCV